MGISKLTYGMPIYKSIQTVKQVNKNDSTQTEQLGWWDGSLQGRF